MRDGGESLAVRPVSAKSGFGSSSCESTAEIYGTGVLVKFAGHSLHQTLAIHEWVCTSGWLYSNG